MYLVKEFATDCSSIHHSIFPTFNASQLKFKLHLPLPSLPVGYKTASINVPCLR